MRVALVAPPFLPCPPHGYGGVERVVASLAEGLQAHGHEPVIFGHPETTADVPVISTALEETSSFEFQRDAAHAVEALPALQAFDLVHNHSVALLLLRAQLRPPMLTTMHGTSDYEAVRPIYRRHRDAAFVSISRAQQSLGLPGLNWIDTIYNGVDTDVFSPLAAEGTTARRAHARFGEDGYLLHLGTLCHRKGTAEAVQVALRSGQRLVLAGRIDPINMAYFDQHVRPHIDGEQIRFVGEVDGDDKVDLYRRSRAVLLPLNWHEPFGLVMAEAGACGIPTIAHRMGSVGEVLVEGRTGIVTQSLEDAVAALERVGDLDPQEIREHVVTHFSIDAMVERHVAVYERLASGTRA